MTFMPTVLQMTRVLTTRPTPPIVADVSLRHFASEKDIPLWLQLRDRAFADENPKVRPWTDADFQGEFLSKPWWGHEAMWFAVEKQAIGSIVLARRRHNEPVVSWLMVDPDYRHRGIGLLLLAALEAAVWDDGGRQVGLETHSCWQQAVAFYRAAGYANL
jgi:GNAT superfamily N-acetyltransferase